MSLRFARRATAALTATALTLVGCGTVTEVSARQELSGALGALDDRSTLTAELSLDVTAERLVELAAANGEVLPLEQAELIAGASVELTVATADGARLESLSPEASPNARIAVRTGGDELGDVRFLDGDLFARVDVPRVAGLAGQPVPTIDELGGDGVPGLGFLETVLGGGWVAVDGDELARLGELFAPTARETPDRSMLDEVRQKVAGAFDRTVTVTEDGSDPELGERTLLQASPRRLLSELPGLLAGFDTPQGDAGALFGHLDPNTVPDEPATVAVYSRDGVATAIRLDLGQFADDGGLDEVALLVRFTVSDEGIEVPVGADPVDVAAVADLLFASLLNA